MSASKKPLKKRKRQSPPPATTSKINRRLDKIRSGQRNLWLDDNDDDDHDEQCVQPKTTTTTAAATTNKTYIVLSDSDDEKTSSRRRRRRSRSNKSRKKTSHLEDDNYSSDTDYKCTSKCVTCLICSILSTLTSYNCCSRHLSLLKDTENTHHNYRQLTTNTDQWPPQQVMIVPMTDELIQRYLNPQEISRLKTQTSSSKKAIQSNKPTRKLSKKSAIISEPSDTEYSNTNKFKSSKKSARIEPDSSPSIIGSAPLNSDVNLPDTTFTVITSTSTTINSFESPNVLDTCQLQQSSDQPIIIDDSQPDIPQGNLIINNTHENKQHDPWTPISDETYAAIEVALDQVDQTPEDQTEFTPATARRTPTDLMASRLPKIQLRKGRFRQGKPIADKNIADTTTDECCSSTTISQASSTSTTTSVLITNTRPPPALATIVEDESLVLPATYQVSDKSSCHILSQRHENTTEGLSDTVMSCLFAQDESSQHDNISITTKITSTHVLSLPAIIIEDCSHENEINRSDDISESSQLTNDQNDTQPLISSTANEKTTTTPSAPTPTRISYRLNPDGSRVSISRPPLPINHQSPLILIRRTSTDTSSMTSHTNQ